MLSLFDLCTEAELRSSLVEHYFSCLCLRLSPIILFISVENRLALDPRIKHLLVIYLLVFGGSHANGGVSAFEAVGKLPEMKSVFLVRILLPLIEHFGKRKIGSLAEGLGRSRPSLDHLCEGGVSWFHSNVTIRL
jgi:hypothetical protein